MKVVGPTKAAVGRNPLREALLPTPRPCKPTGGRRNARTDTTARDGKPAARNTTLHPRGRKHLAAKNRRILCISIKFV